MKLHYYLFLALFSVSLSAQIKYEKGYFIDNHNVKTECLIRNVDWNDTPSEFDYKLSETDESHVKKNHEVKEFAFGDVKFISVDVDVDQSSNKTSTITQDRNPQFKKERLFLKVLVDGTAKLYHYGRNEFQRYFYSVNGSPIQQLIYKKYYVNTDQHTVATNNTYRQQLYTDVRCDDTKITTIEILSYARKSLTDYFESVNICKGDTIAATETKKPKNKGDFNLRASVFLGQQSFSVGSTTVNHDFGGKSYIAFSAEAEYILPVWNNKWAVIFEPSYHSFEKTDEFGDQKVSVDYSDIMLTLGFRHYFHIDDKSRIFLNGGANYAIIDSDSFVKYQEGTHNYNPLEFTDSSLTFALGAGYSYGKFDIEIRYNTTSQPTPYNTVSYKLNNSCAILRYRIF